ncbi:MAG TPA: DNA gyrase inhibitor YacG [Steroidobacteraceae bacterium]|nr:DNA gyrase inhibitor YacG [Steroidobacteraceae bacterium]
MSPVAVKCPTCGRELEWANAPFRPFCSERCRLVDLGAWLSEQRAIPDDDTPLPDKPPDE